MFRVLSVSRASQATGTSLVEAVKVQQVKQTNKQTNKNVELFVVKGPVVSWAATTWLEFVCPANQQPKSTIKKKPTCLCAPRELLERCLSCLIIIQYCYFDYRINKPFACSRCLICAKDHGLFYLNYPQINASGKLDLRFDCKNIDCPVQFINPRITRV